MRRHLLAVVDDQPPDLAERARITRGETPAQAAAAEARAVYRRTCPEHHGR